MCGSPCKFLHEPCQYLNLNLNSVFFIISLIYDCKVICIIRLNFLCVCTCVLGPDGLGLVLGFYVCFRMHFFWVIVSSVVAASACNDSSLKMS